MVITEVEYKLRLLKEGYNLNDIEYTTESYIQYLYESNNIENNKNFVEYLRKIIQWLIDKLDKIVFWIKERFRREIKESENMAKEVLYLTDRAKSTKDKFKITIYSKLVKDTIDVDRYINNMLATVEKITYSLSNENGEYPDWLPEKSFSNINNIISALINKFIGNVNSGDGYQNIIEKLY